jgi:hypothetical protein
MTAVFSWKQAVCRGKTAVPIRAANLPAYGHSCVSQGKPLRFAFRCSWQSLTIQFVAIGASIIP